MKKNNQLNSTLINYIEKELTNALEKYLCKIEVIYICGSIAHNHNNPASDIDILSIFLNTITEEEIDKISKIIENIELPIDFIGIKKSELNSKSTPFTTSLIVKPVKGLIKRNIRKIEYYISIQEAFKHDLYIHKRNSSFKLNAVNKEILTKAINSLFPFLREYFKNPVLSLSRAEYFYQTGELYSKKQAGEWALSFFPNKFNRIISNDLAAYLNGKNEDIEEKILIDFENYIIQLKTPPSLTR